MSSSIPKKHLMTEMTHHIRFYKVLIEVSRIYCLEESGNECYSTNMYLVKCILFAVGLNLTFAFGMLRI